MNVYMENYRGHVLTVVSDCSYSGDWVKQCYEFLDSQGIAPCGHSAIEKGILLKVFASCRPNETACVLTYSLQGITIDKNTGSSGYRINWKVGDNQKSFGRDFTTMLCGRKVDEQCAEDIAKTWKMKTDGERVYLVRGKDKGREAWHYVLLVDDEDTIDKFKEATKGGNVDVQDYGQILESGRGKDPPNEVVDRIHKKYHIRN